MPSPRTAEHLKRLARELDATERRMQHDLDRITADATPAAWLERNLRKGTTNVRRWASRLLAQPNALLILGGLVAGAVLIGWALSGRDDDDEAPHAGVIVRRERSSFFGRMLATALQTFLLYYARKLLMEHLRTDAAEPAPTPAKAPGHNPAGPPPSTLATTPFSQTP